MRFSPLSLLHPHHVQVNRVTFTIRVRSLDLAQTSYRKWMLTILTPAESFSPCSEVTDTKQFNWTGKTTTTTKANQEDFPKPVASGAVGQG